MNFSRGLRKFLARWLRRLRDFASSLPFMNSSFTVSDQTHFKTRAQLYHYAARVTRVYDADTVTVDIDLGLNLWRRDQTIRLWKINAPELRGEERERGLVARDFVRERVLDRDVLLRTILDKRGVDREGKYGRLLGEILFEDESGASINLNALLLERGHAVKYGEDGSAVPSPVPAGAQSAEAAPLPSAVAIALVRCPFCGQLRGVEPDQDRVLACSNCLDPAHQKSYAAVA